MKNTAVILIAFALFAIAFGKMVALNDYPVGTGNYRQDTLVTKIPNPLKSQTWTMKEKSYSGYVRIDNKANANMFFWFFEAQNPKPDTPVIMWLSGGPGCSSELAIFMENGPVHFNLKTKDIIGNPGSWNKNYHVLYVDNPIGTGFSTCDDVSRIPTNQRECSTTSSKCGSATTASTPPTPSS